LKDQLRLFSGEQGSIRSSQQDLQLTQKIKVLELDNNDLRARLAACREQLNDLVGTQGQNAFDNQPSNRNNTGKTTNSMK